MGLCCSHTPRAMSLCKDMLRRVGLSHDIASSCPLPLETHVYPGSFHTVSPRFPNHCMRLSRLCQLLQWVMKCHFQKPAEWGGRIRLDPTRPGKKFKALCINTKQLSSWEQRTRHRSCPAGEQYTSTPMCQGRIFVGAIG